MTSYLICVVHRHSHTPASLELKHLQSLLLALVWGEHQLQLARARHHHVCGFVLKHAVNRVACLISQHSSARTPRVTKWCVIK